jgi:outer membrane protein
MKNGMLIWNVLLSLAVAGLLFFQLKSSGKKNTIVKPATDSTTVAGAELAYFEMDSVEANFDLVKEVKAQITKRSDDLNRNLDALDKSYKAKYDELSAKNPTTKEEIENASNTLNQFGEQLKAQKDNYQQQYQLDVMEINVDLQKQLKKYITEFNKGGKYKYIISYEPGLFYYLDTAHNITGEVIQYLNQSYRQSKKGKPELK